MRVTFTGIWLSSIVLLNVLHGFRLGFDLPRGFNPADFYLKILSNTLSGDGSEHQSFFQRPIEILRTSNHTEPSSVESYAPFDVNKYKMWVI